MKAEPGKFYIDTIEDFIWFIDEAMNCIVVQSPAQNEGDVFPMRGEADLRDGVCRIDDFIVAPSARSCTCDLRTVLMISGCRCGAIERHA